MKSALIILFVSSCSFGMGQVSSTGPLDFNGPEGQRSIQGVGAPISETAAIVVEGSVLGNVHWTTASVNANAITLTANPAVESYSNGMLLRFLAPSDVNGPIMMNCSALAAYPLYRPDGIPPVSGQVRTGAICEVLFAGDRWILMNAPEKGCPTGTTMINERLCIETTPTANMFYFPSVERCAALGGKLCRPDEHYLACVQAGGVLNGLGAAWEWIDDTSNHANTVVQMGFGNCEAQRWADPQMITYGRTRCCFEPR